MKTMSTLEYPTRYVAFANPGVLVEAEDGEAKCRIERAVYHEPMKNRHYPHLEDGICAEIVQCAGSGKIVVDFHVTRPDRSREQSGVAKFVESYQAGKRLLHEWLPTARAFAGSLPSYVMDNDKRYTICIITRDGVSYEEAFALRVKLFDLGYETIERALQHNSSLYRVYARRVTL